jgi:VanZ family protein
MVAMLDEYHQTFVYGRSGSPRDVLIDSIGILIGVIVTRILGFVGRKTIFRWLA